MNKNERIQFYETTAIKCFQFKEGAVFICNELLRWMNPNTKDVSGIEPEVDKNIPEFDLFFESYTCFMAESGLEPNKYNDVRMYALLLAAEICKTTKVKRKRKELKMYCIK